MCNGKEAVLLKKPVVSRVVNNQHTGSVKPVYKTLLMELTFH